VLEVGRVSVPHGLRGEVVVHLVTEDLSRLDPGSVLHTDHQSLEVEAARRDRDRWLVRFAGVEDRAMAERLRGAVLRAERRPDGTDALWVHDAIGAAVVLDDGTRVGTCVAVQANPAADLLELDTGALVPATFVTGHGAGRVVIDPPAGLLDL
jgi:16S rRNA processing protein RimM